MLEPPIRLPDATGRAVGAKPKKRDVPGLLPAKKQRAAAVDASRKALGAPPSMPTTIVRDRTASLKASRRFGLKQDGPTRKGGEATGGKEDEAPPIRQTGGDHA
jgi:hypothetical protein